MGNDNKPQPAMGDELVTEAMMSAGYDATRLEDGTPQFSEAGFCLGHTAKIYAAMHAARTPSPNFESLGDDVVERVAQAVMVFFTPHLKHIVSFNTLCEAIEPALSTAREADAATIATLQADNGRLRGGQCSCAEIAGEDPRCIRHGEGTMWAKENPDLCEFSERYATLQAKVERMTEAARSFLEWGFDDDRNALVAAISEQEVG